MKMRRGASIRRRSDLSGAWLSGAQLSGTTLQQVIFAGAHLNDADLSYADLTNSDFSGADLNHARLWGSILHNAKFAGAKLTGANFLQSYIIRSRQGAPVGDPRGFLGLHPPNLMEVNFEGTDLFGVNLRGAEMTGARFENACIATPYNGLERACGGMPYNSSVLISTKLIRANLRGTSLTGLALYGTDLGGADLQDADLTKADLSSTTLVGANLRGAVLDKVTFTAGKDPDLAETDFRGSKKPTADLLSYAKAAGAILDDNQEAIASKWEADPHNRTAEWLQPGWLSPHNKNQQVLNSKMARARRSIAISQKDYPKEVAAHDLIEYLMIRDSPGDLSEAKKVLDEPHAVDSLRSFEREQEPGIHKMQTLLLAILEEQDDLAAGQEWCHWLDKNRLITWSWDIWNSNFPVHKYSPKQNAKLRAVQLSARGDMSSQDLLEWYLRP